MDIFSPYISRPIRIYIYTYRCRSPGLYIPRQRRETARPILRIPPGSGTTIKGTVRREKQFVPNCSEGFALLDRKTVITCIKKVLTRVFFFCMNCNADAERL
jgi:hypothetical protein